MEPISESQLSSKVNKFETFVNDVLKEDLKKINAELELLNTEVAEYHQLKGVITTLQECSEDKNSFKTQVDIGCNFFIEAVADDPSRILLAVGLGYYVDLSFSEALAVVDKRLALLEKKVGICRQRSATTKAHIKLVLLGLQELQGL